VRSLPGGLELRAATAADHDAICELTTEAFGERETQAVRHLLAGEGFEGRWTVVVDTEGRVVSCSTLLQHQLRYGTVDLPMGQIEFVATSASVRRQGLIRAQFEVLHQWAAEAGLPLMMITGIPYIYRRLGYGYAVDFAEAFRLTTPPEAPEGWTVTTATEADLPEMIALHQQAQDRADLAVHVPEPAWRWHFAGASQWGEEILVARREGDAEGFAWLQLRDEGERGDIDGCTTSVDAAQALLAEAAARAGDRLLLVLDRPRDPWSVVVHRHGYSDPADFRGIYARILDPVGLLDRLRPVLSERLAASPLAGESGELAISLYDTGLVVRYDRGEVIEVKADPEPELDPLDDGKAGVPPDLLPALVLGRYGAIELERCYDDVGYADDRQLVDALFPRMVTDLIAAL
jgi:predicted N-acetyltransferase YhbS